jgi:transcriptional regulator with XRE-family HTH domain
MPFCHVRLRAPKDRPPVLPTVLRHLGDHLCRWRLINRLTKIGAARKLGVDRSTYERWEAGQMRPRGRRKTEVAVLLAYDPPKGSAPEVPTA